MILIINTANKEFVEIILARSKDYFRFKQIKGERKQAENLLVGIDIFLRQNKVKLNQLNGVGVVSGPGGFTSLRIGVVVANILAYALKVPGVGIKLSEFKDNEELVKKVFQKMKAPRRRGAFGGKNIVLPEYGGEANIG